METLTKQHLLKCLWLFVLSLVFIACQKTDESILNSAEFKDVVGVWKPYNNPNIELQITDQGRVIVHATAQRSINYEVYSMLIKSYSTDSSLIKIKEKDTKKKAGHAVVFFKRIDSDTALVFSGMDLDSNGVLPINYTVYQIFVRQK